MDNMTFPVKIFVYGTLMKGYSNHFLLKECTFIGNARTVDKFALFAEDFPFVVSTLHDTHIYGELYNVLGSENLLRLDELEGHPDYYTRSGVEVELIEGLSTTEAQLYFDDRTSTDRAERILSGSFHDSLSSNRHKMVESTIGAV